MRNSVLFLFFVGVLAVFCPVRTDELDQLEKLLPQYKGHASMVIELVDDDEELSTEPETFTSEEMQLLRLGGLRRLRQKRAGFWGTPITLVQQVGQTIQVRFGQVISFAGTFDF